MTEEKKIKILKERRKQLIDALRSGNYQQSYFRLRKKNLNIPPHYTYCVLGVACQVSGLGWWDNDTYEIKNTYQPDPSNVQMPNEVAFYYGFNDTDASFKNEDGNWVSLDQLNDDKWDFEQLADLIESEPKGMFYE